MVVRDFILTIDQRELLISKKGEAIMNGRCCLNITVLKKDQEITCRIFQAGPDCVMNETGKKVTLYFEEVNYGGHGMLTKLCESGVLFLGTHGPGGSYSAHAFVSDNNEYIDCMVSENGNYCVEVDDEGNALPEQSKNIKRYIAIKKTIEKIFLTAKNS